MLLPHELRGGARAREARSRLLEAPFTPDGPALLEAGPPPFAGGTSGADVSCEDDGHTVQVSTPVGGVVAFRERHHSGWRVTDEAGNEYTPFPLNQIHMGVVVPKGERRLTWRFLPPGVRLGEGLLALGLFFACLGIGRGGVLRRLR